MLRIDLGKLELPQADASEEPEGGGDRFFERAAAAQRSPTCAVDGVGG
jgi:hypothetical protein